MYKDTKAQRGNLLKSQLVPNYVKPYKSKILFPLQGHIIWTHL